MYEVATGVADTVERAATTTVPVFAYESCCGLWAKKVRKSLNLTQRELAKRLGISREDIDLFENNLPVSLDIKQKLLEELWVARSNHSGRDA